MGVFAGLKDRGRDGGGKKEEEGVKEVAPSRRRANEQDGGSSAPNERRSLETPRPPPPPPPLFPFSPPPASVHLIQHLPFLLHIIHRLLTYSFIASTFPSLIQFSFTSSRIFLTISYFFHIFCCFLSSINLSFPPHFTSSFLLHPSFRTAFLTSYI